MSSGYSQQPPSDILPQHPTPTPSLMDISFNKWITCPHPSPSSCIRLFCLPFAGGGASLFRLWGRTLSPAVEVCPIQLPGREDRVSEPPYTSLQEAVENLAFQIRPYLQKPFALFGHSMGAIVAFELARCLRRHKDPLPQVLFLSAHRAPHLPLKRRKLHQLPEPEFIRELRRLGGTPAAVFDHQDLLDFILPTLRADFTICDTYHFTPEPPLDCLLIPCAGLDDLEAPSAEVAAWQMHTTQPCSLHEFAGNHFFLQSHRDLLLQTIATTLARARTS